MMDMSGFILFTVDMREELYKIFGKHDGERVAQLIITHNKLEFMNQKVPEPIPFIFDFN